jgi:nitrate/nitrite transport system ATP-binding protein
LSAGPNATLGPAITVDIPRPRDRKAVNHDSRYRQIRREVIDFLLGVGGRKHTAITKKLVLPDIEPEDLTVPQSLNGGRRRPVRRHELKRETVEIDT